MRTRFALYFAIISTLLINIISLYKPLWLPFERRIYNLKYEFNISYEKNEEIIIIDIDEKSLEKLGRYQNWPRAYFAEVLPYLNGAKAVGIDILFAEPDTLPVQAQKFYTKPNFDSLLENAIKENGKVVLVSSSEDKPIFTKYNRIGLGEILTDDDGVVRKGFYTMFGQKTFAAEISEMVKHEIEQERFLIYFVSDNSFRRISFSDVYLKRVPEEYFKDKIVLIGGTAQGLFDFQSVPFKSKGNFPGVLIQANLVNNFINNIKINEISYSYVILLTFIISIILNILTLNKSIKIYLIFNVILYVLFIVFTFILFSFRFEFGVIRPSYSFVITVFISLIYRYRFEEREKRKIKTIFSRYYSKELVEKVMKDPPKLGGEKVQCTVIFADIRNFTPYAEKTDPEKVSQKLNSFLDEMVQTIFIYQGRIDKFIGDCVMAVFGSPVLLENHALNACYAAVDMVQKAEKLGFKIGIGINSGEAISGNFGSPMRMEYTVIGDAVNLASRLERLTKEFDCSIIIGTNTYKEVMQNKHEGLLFKELGRVRVKGKEEELLVYSVQATLMSRPLTKY